MTCTTLGPNRLATQPALGWRGALRGFTPATAAAAGFVRSTAVPFGCLEDISRGSTETVAALPLGKGLGPIGFPT